MVLVFLTSLFFIIALAIKKTVFFSQTRNVKIEWNILKVDMDLVVSIFSLIREVEK